MSKVYTGAGAPSFVPSESGEFYRDTTNDIMYISQGRSSSDDWRQVPVSAPPVADAITDGVTAVAPSENAVFDALALKRANAFTPGTAGNWSGSPATVQAAIDRIAAAVAVSIGNPIP